MTIGAALAKLMKYAKAFASEGVGRYMVKFVDPVIYKYIAEEFCTAAKVLEQARELLHLNHECCHQALQSELFQRKIQDWQELDISVGRFDLRLSPGSVLDLYVAKMQLMECNQDILDLAVSHAQPVRVYIDMATQDVSSRAEFWTEGDVTMDYMRHFAPEFRRYGVQWCPYLHLFYEGELCSGKEIGTSQLHAYRTCCQETQEIIQEVLSMRLGDQCFMKYLKISWQFLEDMMTMQLCRDQRRDISEDEFDEYQASAEKEPMRQVVENIGDGHNLRADQMIKVWEQRTHFERSAKSKFGNL
jgi:hypothetical protein